MTNRFANMSRAESGDDRLFRLLAETIEDVFWMSTPGVSRMVYVSPAYEKVWGRTCRSLYEAPRSFLQNVCAEDRHILSGVVHGAHLEGRAYRCEYRIRRGDGAVRWIDERGFPVRTPGGRLRLMAGVCRDITERKQMESALRQSEAKFRALFEAAPVGIAVLDGERRIVEANAALEGILHLGRDALWEQQFSGRKMILPDGTPFPPDRLASLRAVREQRPVHNVETGVITESGETLWLEVSAVPLDVPKSGVVVVTQDITELRRAEEERNAARRQLNSMDQALRMGMLGIALAHEVNQPLNAILSNAQAALRLMAVPNPDLTEIRQILKDIVADDKRAGEATLQMRRWVRSDMPRRSPVNLNELIRATVELLRAGALLRSQTVELKLDAAVPNVRGCRTQLQQVLLNLLRNALEARSQRGRRKRKVVVRSWLDAKGVVAVSVEDNGCGIAEGRMDRIFEPFFTTRRGGMGLGLPISRSIITDHEGKIWVENVQGSGARVSFVLPVFAERTKRRAGLRRAERKPVRS